MVNKFWTLSLALLLGSCGNPHVTKKNGVINQTAPITPSILTEPEPPKHVFAYTASQYANKISGFSLNTTSGELLPLATPSIDSGALPLCLTSIGGKYLIVANYSADTISSFAIDQETGDLTLVENEALAGGSRPAWVIHHPTKPIVYVAAAGSAKILSLSLDPLSGNLTAQSEIKAGAGVTSLQMSEDGSVLFSADQNVDRVGIYTASLEGNLTAVSTAALTHNSQPNDLKLSKNGKFLYTANWGTGTISSFSVQGSALTSLGPDVSSGSGGVYLLSVSPDGNSLFASKPYGNNYSIHSMNQTTGELAAAQSFPHPGSVSFSFYEDFIFLLGWTSSTAGLPIETRTFASDTVGDTALFSTAGLRGLYQLQFVEIR